MRNAKESYSFGERLMVVAILVVVTLVGMHNLLQSLRESEERTLNAATVQYNAVRNMYSGPPETAPQAIIQASAIDTEGYPASSSK